MSVKFYEIAREISVWNEYQRLYEVEDISKLSFADYIYKPNRSIDTSKVKEIRDFLVRLREERGVYLTGGWVIVLGHYIPDGRLYCLDGQHRWNALSGICGKVLFMVESYETETDMFNGWRAYASAEQVSPWLVRPVENRVELDQRMDQRQFVRVVGDRLHQYYGRIFSSTRNARKPYVSRSQVDTWIAELYDSLPEQSVQGRPTQRTPGVVVDYLIKLNTLMMEESDGVLVEVISSLRGKVRDARVVGGLIGFHSFWCFFRQQVKDRSRKWKKFQVSMDTNNLREILGIHSDEEEYHDTHEE